jgi:hypothetical protein
MKPEMDLDRLADIPDPAAELAGLPPPPRRFQPRARPATRARVAAGRTYALSAALAYTAVLLALFNKRADLSSVPGRTLLLEIAIPLTACGLAFAIGVAPGRSGVGESKRMLVGVAVASPLLFALTTCLAGPADFDPEPFWGHGLRCLLVTGLFTLGPLGLAAWAFRGAFVASAGWRSAALGIACAGLAATAMSLICSTGSPAHVLVGHGGMMIVAGLVGAAFGRRLASA